jgi:tetratricopeptide (TPR) repeat protein
MLSKSMCMTLPALLLLLDAYPLGRIRNRRELLGVLREKIPYFAIMLAGIAAEITAELKSHVIAVDSSYGLADIATQPAYRLSFYLWKTVWPVDLQPMYIFPLERDPTDAIYALCIAGVLAASFALLVLARRTPAPLVAWLAFALLLSPILGLLQAGYHFAADRYTYFAGIVPAALVATGLVQLWLQRRLVWISAAAALAALAVLGIQSHQQSKIWRSSNALWRHTVDVDPGNYIGHYNLAHDYADREDYDRAIDHYTRAIRSKQDEPRFWYNRGLAWFAKRKPEQAVADFDRAIELDPQHWQAYNNRGTARLGMSDLEGAVADFTRALEIRPNLPGTLANRARAYERLGDVRAARADRELSRRLHRGT